MKTKPKYTAEDLHWIIDNEDLDYLFFEHGVNLDEYDIPKRLKAEFKAALEGAKPFIERLHAASDELDYLVDYDDEDES